jgi:molybdopterin molybdotransferase
MADLLPVDEAIARIVAGVVPLKAETVSIDDALGRTLAEPLSAKRTQPPFDASSMDGYAVRAADISSPPVRLRVIGSVAAGANFTGKVGPGEAVHIFTGAPMPDGADAVLIQEDVTAIDPATVVANTSIKTGSNVRRAGLDFREGAALLPAGTMLAMREIALAAAMGHGSVSVRHRPRVAIVSTGDELVPAGTSPAPNQIVSASAPGVAAYMRSLGAEPHDLGIVRDDKDAIGKVAERALALPADVLVTLGGASVGDHDLVGAALRDKGMTLDFWRIAMRPGKPLMFGRIGPMRVLGLPGNPVSSLVCALLFLRPLIDAMLGRLPRDLSEPAILGVDVPGNNGRQDYVRATLVTSDGLPKVTPLPVQDSSMLSVLAAADCLLIRAPNAPAARAGTPCRIIRLP